MSQESLKKKAASGFAYRFAERALAKGIGFVLQLLLARCAAPGQTVSVVWNKEDVCDLVTRYEDCSLGEVMRRQAQVTNTVLDFSDDNEQCG